MTLTLESLTDEQKEFIQSANKGDKNKELDIVILNSKSKFIEYGDQYVFVKFIHKEITYECAFVYQTGPAVYDWEGNNPAGETCYLEIVDNIKKTKKYHLVICTSLRGRGDVSLTIKNVPDELNKRIIKKYGSYQEMIDEGHVNEYEEFLNSPELKPLEIFHKDNE